MIKFLREYFTTNSYSGSDWNFEETTKFIFLKDQQLVEAGFFVHYVKKNDRLIEKKSVIELPSSIGCPMRCNFCASSSTNSSNKMSADDIYAAFLYIFENKKMKQGHNILVSMMGIGDLFFTIDEVKKVIKRISASYPYITFSVSSCLWTESMMRIIEDLSHSVKFRAIQITYISDDNDKLRKMIGQFKHMNYDVYGLISLIKKSSISIFRINYILIENINDSWIDIKRFTELFYEIKDRLIVRLSTINETEASRRNNINGISNVKMMEINSFLKGKKFNSYVFYSVENDNMNCGQLISEKRDYFNGLWYSK